MKRVFAAILLFAFLSSTAHADPLPLLDDYAGDIVIPYDDTDPSAGVFSYSYRYPRVDENVDGGAGINVFYQDLIDYTVNFTVPMFQDAFEGEDSSTVISYTVTCNNDDYFSVLVKTQRINPDRSDCVWKGHVFSRKHGSAGYTYSLPKLLGLLDPDENEEWIQDFQKEKADNLIRDMVWDLIEENKSGIDYRDLTEETLTYIFFPEEDFYLDENGDPVFYIQPGDVYAEASEQENLLVFPLALEDILDEL